MATKAACGRGQTVSSSGEVIFDGSVVACTGLQIGCQSTSAVDVEINIPSLHGSTYCPLYKGASQEFVDEENGIGTVTVRGVSGTGTIDWGVTRRSASQGR